jgi:hypothetical protein
MSEILYQRPKYSARKSSQKMRPKSLKTDLTPNNSKVVPELEILVKLENSEVIEDAESTISDLSSIKCTEIEPETEIENEIKQTKLKTEIQVL